MKKVGFCKLITRANNVFAVVLQLTRFNRLYLIPKRGAFNLLYRSTLEEIAHKDDQLG